MMKNSFGIEILNLLLHAAEEEVGRGNALVNPFGSITYSNPLSHDEFPFDRVEDLEAITFYDGRDELDYNRVMKRFKDYLRKNGFDVEKTEMGVKIILPDGSEKYMCSWTEHFDDLKKDMLFRSYLSLFTNELFGNEEIVNKLKEAQINGKVKKEDVRDSLSVQCLWLYSNAEDLADEENPKFYKRLVEISKYRGERPEIRESLLRKFDEWKKYLDSKGKIEGKVADKLQGEWEAISTDYRDFDKSKKLIDENLRKDENGLYRLKFN